MIFRSKTPLRIGLSGGGTDINTYSDLFKGNVLNATIDLYSYCTIEDSENVQFIATDLNKKYTSNIEIIEKKIILDLHRGVYNRIVKDYLNNVPIGIKITTYSDVPPGSGLGSSSTMVVTIIKCFAAKFNLPLGDYDIAKLAYKIERENLGLKGGSQDQYAATFGGFNFMEFHKGNVIVNPLRIRRWFQHELSNSMILFYTGNSRSSSNIINEQIQNINENNEDSIEIMHEMKNSAIRMKNAILNYDVKLMAKELELGWNIKKNMSNSITNKHIDDIYNTAINTGAYSGKISGAGGGGFIMFMCNPVDKFNIIRKLESKYGNGNVKINFTEEGSVAWKVN